MSLLQFKKKIGVLTSGTLVAALLAAVPITTANATPEVSTSTTTNPTNTNETVGTVNGSLMTAAVLANSAVVNSATSVGSGSYLARSVGLVSQDAASGTAQLATVRANGVLSLYAKVSTTTAISATSGTFASSTGHGTKTYNSANTSTLFTFAADISAGTAIATLWTAPSVAGSYTITLSASNGTAATTVSTDSPTLGLSDASIEVTVTNELH